MTAHLLVTVTAGGIATDIGRSLRESFFMFWETLWALVLGFSLSGAVQAFVSRSALERRLGNHRPAAIVRASLYGMASSSCSYAAAAMARSLVRKGADFVAALVFMVASTNLVIELGIVLVVLIGWQFMAAEVVGGVIMIVLLAACGAAALGRVSLHSTASDANLVADEDATAQVGALSRRVRSLAGWSDAAGYAIADLRMLRREIVIGYGVAGALTTLVPAHVWSDLFISGHGFGTTVENAFVGPLIAVISFVCSIGNVPLAAALWKGGIGFGGVVSFLFADLITMPLLLIYRRYYGTATTLRILGLFWTVMAVAGIATEELFRATGLVSTTRPKVIAPDHWSFGPTTVLDVVFLAAFVALLVLHRNRANFAGGRDATDPVCGMRVERAQAPARADHHGITVYFCSDPCHDRFIADPARFLPRPARELAHATPATPVPLTSHRATPTAGDAPEVDPVCGMAVTPDNAAARRHHAGGDHYFCSEGCATAFDAEPDRYVVVSPTQ